jgi:hypothetical protein
MKEIISCPVFELPQIARVSGTFCRGMSAAKRQKSCRYD